jgi:hypothetical protein
LYYPPSHTEEVLQEVTSGASTVEELADGLGYATRTASNKVHDPVILGLVERQDSKLSITEDARRVVQLKDTSPLETAFCDLAGVDQILDRIEEEQVGVEQIGRIISFETESNAAAESTFKNYGRVYAEWIEYLDLGNYSEGLVAVGEIDDSSEDLGPLENPRGANCPRVRPEKVFEIIPLVSKGKSREEIEDISGYSDREVSKILTTCYGLGITESSRDGPQLTDRGKEIQQESIGNRKQILQKALYEVPLVQAYCDRAPDEKFRNQDIMKQISEDYAKGWSNTTIETRAKRLYSWLLFTELFEERSRGYLQPGSEPDAVESVSIG